MPVLKQYQTTPAMREAIVLDLGDIGAQASKIRATAQTQAQQIIADAQAKAEQIAREREARAQDEGYSTGLEQGLAEGKKQGHAEAMANAAEQLRQLTTAWSQVATEWEQQRTAMEREARQAVLEFALSATEKIVHRVIEIDESVIVDQTAAALSIVLSAHDASVRIHPVDRPMLEDALPQLLSELATIEHIELHDDEAITPGGCEVVFGQGRIDATIERQLSRLVDLILPAPELVDPTQAPAETRPAGQAQTAEAPASTGLDAAGPAPVYEITEQGLVETKGSPSHLEDQASQDAQHEESGSDGSVEETDGGAT